VSQLASTGTQLTVSYNLSSTLSFLLLAAGFWSVYPWSTIVAEYYYLPQLDVDNAGITAHYGPDVIHIAWQNASLNESNISLHLFQERLDPFNVRGLQPLKIEITSE